MKYRYAALVPLRGGSKSIPGKNVRVLGGKPLCYWTLSAATRASSVSAVWVSTDSTEIADVVHKCCPSVLVHRRPDILGGDLVQTEDVIREWIESAKVTAERIITLQATSPQTSADDIDSAVRHYEETGGNSLVTGTRTHRFFWGDDGVPINYDPASRPMRQQWTGTFMENGAFYISEREALLAGAPRLHGKVSLYCMRDEAGIELDEPEDWSRMADLFRRQGRV